MIRNILIVSFTIVFAPFLHAGEWRGNITLENRYFPNGPTFSEQHDNAVSLSLEPEYVASSKNNDLTFTFKPFFRYDEHDDERTHADLRELGVVYATGDWEWRVGVSKVYWGVTESQHLVDIINQTDFVEDLDSEDKLGQPMINATWIKDWGVLDFFVLPGFRERTFPGKEGRLRSGLVVDTDAAEYESSAEEGHVDGAIRWSHSLGAWDVGAYYFRGTSRDPELIPRPGNNGQLVLIPRYNQIDQLGFEAQATLDAWLLKLEVIAREGKPEDYTAAVGGFEYTFVGMMDSATDLGAILEYNYDERGEDGVAVFQNDLFAGFRFAFNDEQSSEILAGGFFDLDKNNRFYRVEASRRLGQSFKLSGVAQIFDEIDEKDLQFSLRDDDFLELSLAYFF